MAKQFFLLIILSYFLIKSHTFELRYSNSNEFYKLPRFWTNTGFCPRNYASSDSLLTDDIKLHLNLLGALPKKGISLIRVHWLLYLIKIIEYDQNHLPVYDFNKLDKFVEMVHEAGLSIGFEFMGDIFKNHTVPPQLWKDLSYQIGKRYLDKYGIKVISKWKFESWNEPDLNSYNLLNFTINEYLEYLQSLKAGLNAVSLNSAGKPRFKLYGPAGLFKSKEFHKLCWAALQFCEENKTECPIDVITFHRKGAGHANEILKGERELLKYIFQVYPSLQGKPFSNDEADPISRWSTPRDFQSDIRYATSLIAVIFKHWAAKINSKYFKNLESISHDNAFLSYHPFEFSQRTLFARFQMNESNPIYSQFIAKPIYTALGMLSNLGELATNIETIVVSNHSFPSLTTRNNFKSHLYIATFISSPYKNQSTILSLSFKLPDKKNETFAYCLETLETNETNPIEIWNLYGRQPYPNSTTREWMRRVQGPKVLEQKTVTNSKNTIHLNFQLKSPWIAMLRICDLRIAKAMPPINLRILKVTKGEILILWNEIDSPERCIKTHQVHFFAKKSENTENNYGRKDRSWKNISRGWRVPFLSFQFRPKTGKIEGCYKVRSENIFGKVSKFSEEICID